MSQQTESCEIVENERWVDGHLSLDDLQFNRETRSLKFFVHHCDYENGYTVKESFFMKKQIVPTSNVEIHVSNVDEMKCMIDLHDYSTAPIRYEKIAHDSYEIHTLHGAICVQGSGIKVDIVSKTKGADTYIRIIAFGVWEFMYRKKA